MFCAPVIVFGGTEGVGSCFRVLHAWTRFRWYRGRRVPFSCFARPNSFSAVTRASAPIFTFCAYGPISGGTVGVPSRFHVFCSRTCFRRYRGRRVPFSCFALSDSFSAVPWASGPIFVFCAPGLVFGCIEGVRPPFHVLHSRTSFRWYRGRRVPFSYVARPDSFSVAPSASDSVFMFCAPGLIFGGKA
jgi:hypothetical protein